MYVSSSHHQIDLHSFFRWGMNFWGATISEQIDRLEKSVLRSRRIGKGIELSTLAGQRLFLHLCLRSLDEVQPSYVSYIYSGYAVTYLTKRFRRCLQCQNLNSTKISKFRVIRISKKAKGVSSQWCPPIIAESRDQFSTRYPDARTTKTNNNNLCVS